MDPDDPVIRVTIYSQKQLEDILKENRDFYDTLDTPTLVSVFQDMMGVDGNEFFNNYGRIIIDYPAGKEVRFEDSTLKPELIVFEFISFFKELGHENTDTYFKEDFVDFLRAYSIMRDKHSDESDLDVIGDGQRIIDLFCRYTSPFLENEEQAAKYINFLRKYIEFLKENDEVNLNEDFEDDIVFCLFPNKKEWDLKLMIPSFHHMVDTLLKNGLSKPERMFDLLFVCVKNDDVKHALLLLDKGAPLIMFGINIYESVASAEMVDSISEWIRKHPERIDQGLKQYSVFVKDKHGRVTEEKVIKVDTLKLEHVINDYLPNGDLGRMRRSIMYADKEDIFKAFIRNQSLFEMNDLYNIIHRAIESGSDYFFVVDYLRNLFPGTQTPFPFDEDSKEDMLRWKKIIASVANKLDAKKWFSVYNANMPFEDERKDMLYGDLISFDFPTDKTLLYILGIIGAVTDKAKTSVSLMKGISDRIMFEKYRITEEQNLGGKRIPGLNNKDMTRLITLLSREDELCANLEEYLDFPELVALYLYLFGKYASMSNIQRLYRDFYEDPHETKSIICTEIREMLSKRTSNPSPPVSPTLTRSSGEELMFALDRNNVRKLHELIDDNIEVEGKEVPLVDLNETVYSKENGEYRLPLSVAFTRKANNLIIFKFLDRGARFDKKDGSGNTPITYGYYSGYGEMIEEYLEEHDPEYLKDPSFKQERDMGTVASYLARNPITTEDITALRLILENNPNIDTSRKIEGISIHDMVLRNFGRMKGYKEYIRLFERENALINRLNEEKMRQADEERRRTGKYVEPQLEPLAVYRGNPNPDKTDPDILNELEILLYDYENKQKNQ